jgi:hypothetical protein
MKVIVKNTELILIYRSKRLNVRKLYAIESRTIMIIVNHANCKITKKNKFKNKKKELNLRQEWRFEYI